MHFYVNEKLTSLDLVLARSYFRTPTCPRLQQQGGPRAVVCRWLFMLSRHRSRPSLAKFPHFSFCATSC
jgi:hypothetical protein